MQSQIFSQASYAKIPYKWVFIKTFKSFKKLYIKISIIENNILKEILSQLNYFNSLQMKI